MVQRGILIGAICGGIVSFALAVGLTALVLYVRHRNEAKATAEKVWAVNNARRNRPRDPERLICKMLPISITENLPGIATRIQGAIHEQIALLIGFSWMTHNVHNGSRMLSLLGQ